jgi:MFS transporter, FHS family, L-fucose permease
LPYSPRAETDYVLKILIALNDLHRVREDSFQSRMAIGSFLVNYLGLPEIANLSARTAAGYVSFYWGGAMVCRFIGAPLLERFKPGNLLAYCTIAAVTLVVALMALTCHVAMWTILAVGVFNSIMFPTVFSLGEAELGPLSGTGSGLLNMAIGGGAIIPVIQGFIADHAGLHHAFVVPVVCYLYILFYTLKGSKPNSERYTNV